MFDCVSSSGWPATAEGRGEECLEAAEGSGGGRRRRVAMLWRVVETEGDEGGGQRRVAEAEGGRI